MPEEEVTRLGYADGTLWERMNQKHATPTQHWGDTEKGLINLVLDALSSITNQFGLGGDASFFPTANPGGTPNVVRVSSGFALFSPGLPVGTDNYTDVSAGVGDVGKYIALRRSYDTYNEQATPTGENSVDTLRIHYPSVFLSTSLEAQDFQLGLIADVDPVLGTVTLETSGRRYWTPNSEREGISSDRIGISSIDDMQALVGAAVTNSEDFQNQVASGLNYLFNAGDPVSNYWNNFQNPATPDVPTGIIVQTGMDTSYMYNGLSIFSANQDKRAWVKLAWTEPVAEPTPHFYDTMLVPLLNSGGGDVELPGDAIVQSTKDRNNIVVGATVVGVATSIMFHGVPPKVKFRPYVRSVRDTLFNPAQSSWAAGEDFYSGMTTVGVPDPGGLVLSVESKMRGFHLSWDSVVGAAEYAVYGKEGSVPDISPLYLVVPSPIDGNEVDVLWPYTTEAVYFRVVPLNRAGGSASWSIQGNNTMDTTSDTPTTSDQVTQVIDAEKAALGLPAWQESLGVDNQTAAMKKYVLVDDARIPVILVGRTTPVAGAATSIAHGFWTADGNYTIKRIGIRTAVVLEVFAGTTVATLVKNDLALITLSCTDGLKSVFWTDADEDVVSGDELRLALTTTNPPNDVVAFVEVIKRYT